MNLGELKTQLSQLTTTADQNVEAIVSLKKHFIRDIKSDVDKVTFIVSRTHFKIMHPNHLLETLNNIVTGNDASLEVMVEETNAATPVTGTFSNNNFFELNCE